MKKKILIGVGLCTLVFLIGTVCSRMLYRVNHSVSGTWTFLKEDYVREINLKTGIVENLDFATYSHKTNATFLSVEEKQMQTTVVQYSCGKRTELFTTELEIKGLPVLNNQSVYFKAKERTGDIALFLWVWTDGVLRKCFEAPIHNDFIISDNTLLFILSEEWWGGKIQRMDLSTHQCTPLISGKSIIWKEPGKSFFFCTKDGMLAAYNLNDDSVQYLSDVQTEKVEDVCGYDPMTDIIFLYYPDPYNQKAIERSVPGFFVLKTGKLYNYYDYIQKMGFNPVEEYYVSSKVLDLKQ